MAEPPGPQPAQPNTKQPRRKLSRQQVIDILERNVQLYRDEPNFVHYLVELAIYLMEYEYDWAQSDAAAPGHLADENGPPVPFRGDDQSGRTVFKKLQTHIDGITRSCPFCGNEVGGRLICPHCRNMTR